MSTFRARRLWDGEHLREDAVVELDDDGLIRVVRPARASDGPAADGLLLPGLINAHTHVERTGPRAPGGRGLAAWVADSVGPLGDDEAGAAELHQHGVAAVSDISNEGDTGLALARHRVAGVIQHELLGHDPARTADALSLLADYQPTGPLPVRPTAHGPHSTAAVVLHAALRWDSPHPASLHLAEHPDESAYLRDKGGPFGELLTRWGVDTRQFDAPGTSSVTYLHALGLLGPRLLAVHAVDTTPDDIALLGTTRTPVVTCPRSSLHIGGRYADLLALDAAGVPLLLGTDGRGSSPDLDPLAEVAELLRRTPELPATRWLHALTALGADTLHLPGLGRLVPGTRPGLLLLHGVRDPADLSLVPSREWLALPGAPS